VSANAVVDTADVERKNMAEFMSAAEVAEGRRGQVQQTQEEASEEATGEEVRRVGD
jgi:hypothetical protein